MKENNSNDCLDLQEIEKGLKNSPLYNLSMANKELFHSNFLAWLGTRYPSVFENVFRKLLGNKWPDDLGEFTIKREYKHYDISVMGKIMRNNCPNIPRILIENKVKSIPTQEQLERYKTEEKDNCQFILLTVTQNLHDNEEVEGWKTITYKELSDQLSKVNCSDFSDTYHFGLLKDYCSYIEKLQLIIEGFDSEESYYSSADSNDLKKELGIHDICGKRKAQMIHRKLVREFEQKGYSVVNNMNDLRDNKIKIAWDYTNMPVVEVRLKARGIDEYMIVQIQGKQYRHAVEYFDDQIGDRIENDPKAPKISFIPSEKGLEYLREHYSDFLELDQATPPKYYPFKDVNEFGQNEKRGYCKYCNGRFGNNGKISCFVYQWVEIPSEMTCDDLVSCVINDIKSLFSRIKHPHPTFRQP